MPHWNKEVIACEIRRAFEAGDDLSYSGFSRACPSLFRAATRYFGTWQSAVEAAGICYDAVRRYRAWTNEKILAAIRDRRARGLDLSWRHVAEQGDPGLAAAATRSIHFGSWRAAVTAAGLDYDHICRYRRWSRDGILRAVRQRHARGLALNAKTLERDDTALLTAARRRFASWEQALDAAGLCAHRRLRTRCRHCRDDGFARRPPSAGAALAAARSQRHPAVRRP